MSTGLSVKIPLTPDAVDGFYKLNKTLGEVAKQNVKMVVLTCPGERIMDPEFGVGVRNYLFSSNTETYESLSQKIREQVRRYVPFVEIREVNLLPLNQEVGVGGQEENYLGLQILYFIPNLNLNDALEIKIFNN